MQPGLSRAIPMSILGFIGSVLFVLLFRWLQGVEPLWNPEIGFVLAVFVSAFAFVYGMGGADPRMNQHHHAPSVDEFGIVRADEGLHDDHAEEAHEAEPFRLLSGTMWQVSLWTIVLIVVIFGAATLPTGFTMQISNDPAASRDQIGYDTVELPILEEEVALSQFTVFAGLVGFTLVSLMVIGGGIGLALTSLANGVAVTKAVGDVPLERVDLKEQPGNPWVRRIVNFIKFAVAFVVLYVVFYVVLIGLVIPNPESTRQLLSIVNAGLFAVLLVYTLPALRIIGKVAGWLAKVLRGAPQFLGQK